MGADSPTDGKNVQTNVTYPTNGVIRDYLLDHFDRDRLEVLLADVEELVPPKRRREKIRLEMIAGPNSTLPALALKIVDWFESQGLTQYLLEAIRATPVGKRIPI